MSKKLSMILKKSATFLGVFTFLMGVEQTYANPMGGSVAAGGIVIQNSGTTTTIHQGTTRGIINWQSFNINAGETTHFNQPIGGVTLNRISPLQGASQIYGRLTATGRVILINAAGIYFGPSSYVNVGGLIASTADITDRDFLSGNYHFVQNPNYNGAVINQGTLVAANHGLIALMGNAVQNDGTIQANLGTSVLGSGTDFSISFAGNNNISFKVNSGTVRRAVDNNGNEMSDGVRNTGRIIANGGQVIVSAQAARNVLDNAINMRGYVEAKSATALPGGGVILGSNDKIRVASNINVTGTNATGGRVSIEAPDIVIESPTTINASGDLGGGKIVIGSTANSTYIAPGTTLLAKALLSGNGGFVETSGHEIKIDGLMVDTRSANGTAGTWLLDPTSFTVDQGFADIILAVLQYSNAFIQTTNDGNPGAGDIIFESNVIWNMPYKFTVSAYRNIIINAGVTIGGTNPGSGLDLFTNNSANFIIGSGGGLITQTGSINSAGPVNLYYNPASTAFNNRVYTNSGSGTLTHWLYLNNLNNFNTIRNTSTLWNKNFALNTNLNVSSVVGFTPIGNATTPFSGKFDGLGNAFNFLSITNATNNTGLFGVTSASAIIKNIFLQNLTISGAGVVGGIVGNNAGIIDNVGVLSGRITGSGVQIGGIVGLNSGVVSNVSNYATIIGGPASNSVGGIIGRNTGLLYNAISVGAVSGPTNSAAVVGTNAGTVFNVFWDGETTGKTLGRSANTGSFSGTRGCFTFFCPSGNVPVLTDPETYTSAGWDFDSENSIWGIIPYSSYPYQKVRFPSPPQVLAGNIGAYTYYIWNPFWIPSGVTIPDWVSGFEHMPIANQRIDLVSGGTGGLYGSTYSNANGAFYMIEQTKSLQSNIFQLQIGDSVYKSNAIFRMPPQNTAITNLRLALNAISVMGNGEYNAQYGNYFYNRISNENIIPVSHYHPNDVLYTMNGSKIILKNGVGFNTGINIWFDLSDDIIATNGYLAFNGLVTIKKYLASGTNVVNLTTNNSGDIYLYDLTWDYFSQDYGTVPNLNTLKITSASHILFDGYVDGYARDFDGTLLSGGSLDLSAPYSDRSIVTSQTGIMNLFNFNLTKGKWYQYGVDGPSTYAYGFYVANNFSINSGVMPSTQAEFLRVAYGDGTPGNPYGVPDVWSFQGIGSSPETLAASWEFFYNSGFNIFNMINWNGGKGFVPIGTLANPFTGTFDGRNVAMQAPVILRPTESYVGLFGVTSPSAILTNISVFNSPIQGNNYVGLIGYNQGTVSNVTLTGSYVLGNNYVGTIAGYNSGLISNISTYANRQLGTSYVGGVAGLNAGTIENVMIAHYIYGSSLTGGIAGVNTGTIRNSFWDTDVTGQRYASGSNQGTQFQVYGGCLNLLCFNGGGRVDLSQMKTFLPQSQGGLGLVSGWDLATDSIDENHLWRMIPGYSYPFLNYQTGGNARVYRGALNPGYPNQLLALFAGVTIGEGWAYTFVYPLITGANGSFYNLIDLTDAPNNKIVIAATGSNITGSVAFDMPSPSILNPSGSVKGLTIGATPNGKPSSNNLALPYEQVLGLFAGYTFEQINQGLNPYNQTTYVSDILTFLSQYSSQLNQISSSIYGSNYYFIYSNGTPIKVYTNVDENIRTLLRAIDSDSTQLLNRYVIQKITPNACKI